jgi:small subunit ribosomal protein S8
MEERAERAPATARAEAPAAAARPEPAGAARAERPRRAAPAKRPSKRRGGVVTDPVADMLTRIRNASRARHDVTTMPTSRMKVEIAKILQSEGFIAGHDVAAGALTVRLKYVQGRIPAITDLIRVSRPGLRVYAARRELPLVRRGLGVSIVSTSRGLMSGREAARQGLGGEVVCTVW